MTDTNTPKKPRVIKHRDAKIEDLREDIVKLQAQQQRKQDQLDALLMEAENEQAIANLSDGDAISYAFGRAATRRIRSGVVRAVAENDKGLVQIKVETGEGFESEFNIIDASAVLLTPEQVETEQARIDAAQAAAEAKAAEQEGAE